MLYNYFKVAIRSIFRNKLTAFINIAGLALAMMCALLIYLYVIDELRYDQYNKNADRTYRITRDFLSQDGTTNLRLANVAPPIGPLIKNDFGQIEVMARTINYGFVIGLEENGELKKVFNEDYMFVVEPEIFKIFDFNIKSGDPTKALERPFTVMLSEKTAEKYFGNQNVIGKRLRAGNQYDLEVTGVFESLPAQAHWHPELLVSFNTLNDTTVYGRKGLETNWGNNSFGTYILLEEGADPKTLEAAMPDFLNKHFGPYAISNWGAPPDFVAAKSTMLHVEKVTDIHLLSHRDDELETNGSLESVYMMSIIGLFIILIACFNFINLSTARATKRAKEVGLRKVVGAFKNQLISQYLSESVLIALFALMLAIAFSFLSITWLNTFTGKELSLNFMKHGQLFVGLIAFSVFVGLLAGIYPAFVISSYKPALVLKGQQGQAKGKSGIRKGLVVAQFAISTALIIATAITFQQLGYLNTRDLGYDKNSVVRLSYFNELSDNYDAFYNELTKSSLIKNAGRSTLVPTNRLLNSAGPPRIMKGDSLINSTIETKNVYADVEFFKTYTMEIAAGRDFDKSIKTDDSLAFIVNETAAREYGWINPKEAINQDFMYSGTKGKLIGIVKDFHFESLHQRIVPMVFYQVKSGDYNDISIKISGDNFQAGIAHLEKVWKEFLPNRPFDYQFISDRYKRLYEVEEKQSQLFTIFSGLAIFIACLGLFGLATFNTLQRVKEIGIRKVLGATVSNILILLSTEIIVLILIANLIAWPVAWIFMNKWLDTFAYHINMNLLVFALSAVAAVLVALFTVSTQTIRAARKNPSDTLRYE